MKFTIVLFALIAAASAQRTLTVHPAGASPGVGPTATLAPGPFSTATAVCPEDYPNGFSIKCDARNINPFVRFFVNGVLVQTEGDAPYLIAGDISSSGIIGSWTGYLAIAPRPDGTRRIRIKCSFANNNGAMRMFTRKIVISAPGCGQIWEVES